MKLTDKRFWKFEAIVLACTTTICIFIMWINHLFFFNLMVVAFYFLFFVGGIVAWKLYKAINGGNWLGTCF